MTSELHKGMVSSVTSVNNWSGTAWLTPVLGAYIADSYLGRFWTITLALLINATVSSTFFLNTTLKPKRVVYKILLNKKILFLKF